MTKTVKGIMDQRTRITKTQLRNLVFRTFHIVHILRQYFLMYFSLGDNSAMEVKSRREYDCMYV